MMWSLLVSWAAFRGLLSRNRQLMRSTAAVGSSGTASDRPAGHIVIPRTVNGRSVTEIAADAYGWCSGITSIVVPASVHTIGNGAFNRCSALRKVELEAGSALRSIGVKAFAGCLCLAVIEFPDSLESIGDFAFLECRSLTSVSLPESLKSLGEGTFAECAGVKNFVVESSNAVFTSHNGWLLNKVQSSLVHYPLGSTKKRVKLTQSRVIGKYAFATSRSMTTVHLGEELIIIHARAFEKCRRLKVVVFSRTVSEIGDHAFFECESVEEIDLSETNVRSIGAFAFSGCQAVRKVVLPGRLHTISAHAFEFCEHLEIVDMTGTRELTTIEPFAFYKCTNIRMLSIPKNVTYIGNHAFFGCKAMESLVFEADSHLAVLGEHVFGYMSNLPNIMIPRRVASIPEFAFVKCKRLKQVGLTTGLREIRDGAFSQCGSLEKSIVLPKSVSYVGRNAFYKTSVRAFFIYNCSAQLFSASFPNTTKCIMVPHDCEDQFVAVFGNKINNRCKQHAVSAQSPSICKMAVTIGGLAVLCGTIWAIGYQQYQANRALHVEKDDLPLIDKEHSIDGDPS